MPLVSRFTQIKVMIVLIALLFQFSTIPVTAQETSYVIYRERDGKLYSVVSSGGDIIPLYPNGFVEQYSVSSNGYVVILDGHNDLFTIPINGGDLIQLNQPGQRIDQFILSADGQYVAYVDQAGTRYGNLYSNLTTGGEPVVLNSEDLRIGTYIYGFYSQIEITSDSSKVVFTAQTPRDVIHLYSVPIFGGENQQISDRLSSGGNVIQFSIASDSNQVIYFADQVADEVYGLFGVNIDGGEVMSLTPDTDLDPSHLFMLSPNGQYAATATRTDKVYLIGVSVVEQKAMVLDETADACFCEIHFTRGNQLLYAGARSDVAHLMPLIGQDAISLDVRSLHGGTFLLSPDEMWIISHKNLGNSTADQYLLSYSLTDGKAIDLAQANLDYASGSFTSTWRYPVTVSPDSKYVIFVKPDENAIRQYYSVPIAGGTVVQLNEYSGSQRFGNHMIRVTADSSRVVFINDAEAENYVDLYSAPIAGGENIRLTDDSSQGVNDFILYPPGSVWYPDFRN